MLNHSTGEFHPGRCKATNLCDYCARLAAVETSEMLLLDAMEDAPTLYVVLTARELLTRAVCRGHLRQLRKSLRLIWPDVRWAVLVEFQKRGALHLNLLVKGVPADDLAGFHQRIVSLWLNRVDGEPHCQWSDVMNEAVGVVQYVSLHFMKPAQAPPLGWRGHRFSATRDYLVRPAAVMREEARRSLRLKRLLHRGLSVEDAELELAAAPVFSFMRHPGRPMTDAAPPSIRGDRLPPCPPTSRRRLDRARADVKPAQRATARAAGALPRSGIPRRPLHSPGLDS